MIHKNNSYIIVDKATGEGVLEFWNPSLISKVNTAKYTVQTALKYLCDLNHKKS